MQTKTVGVVIPIYNVQKYLKECLDSVINQTYKNLQVVLVNDGSTDENSLSIAKEYTLKDERFILFDKKNGGLSSARNVGIEYFSGEYKLKNITTQIKENSLIEFELDGNNPYNIYKVYKSYKAFNNKKDLTKFTYPIIDYIIFLDSDDYWELDCIEECVPRMDGVEVVWFEEKCFFDKITPYQRKSCMDFLRISQDLYLDCTQWFRLCYKANVSSMWTSVLDLIDFNYLKATKLKFIDGIIHEDNIFRILLYINASKIYITKYIGLNHRIRENSIMDHGSNAKKNLPSYACIKEEIFEQDLQDMQLYFKKYSWFVMIEKIFDFYRKQDDKRYMYKYFLLSYLKIYDRLSKHDRILKIDDRLNNIKTFLSLETKTVGVVIPIYNVQKYLKECLDSVINQTYKNLQIILVNDGSTDENSLNIAKEYTLKDKRFILFDKKNGGQSSARNVGIEYFSGEYKLKNITTQIKENSLIEFELDGNNPYNIYKVYKSYKAFNNKKDLTKFTYPIIDYIIFLDSDDYWELDCIEECVPRMDGVEVVWFDYNQIYETGYLGQVSDWTWFFAYSKNYFNEKISSLLWLERYKQIKHFAFVWQGMINFDFLKNIKLKFIDGIFHQDVHFGFLLFVQSSCIFLLSKKLLTYRIRNGATTVRNFQNNFEDEMPFYIKDLLGYFDIKKAKEYYSIYSWVQIILNVIHLCNIKDNLYSDLYYLFIGNLGGQILKLKFSYKQDPMYLNDSIEFIKTFVVLYRETQNFKYGTAKTRIQNQLSYKLGQALILNSKSVLGFLSLPFIILSIVISHKQEQKAYKFKVKKNPNLALPPLETYPDYKEALKEKECFTYKLGEALIRASQNWYGGGYIKFIFKDVPRLKREWGDRKK
ncbi:glycosyl transferase, group 2 family protein [Campylobacter jejuni subsp. doylei]|nr:glycosyl transferase, group 2 family protein [Campylobacter jejuni subsp. doylei]